MNQTVLPFTFFCGTQVLENWVNSNVKRLYGSSVDDTIHGVQMDNLLGKDNTSWNITFAPVNVGQSSLLSCKP